MSQGAKQKLIPTFLPLFILSKAVQRDIFLLLSLSRVVILLLSAVNYFANLVMCHQFHDKNTLKLLEF